MVNTLEKNEKLLEEIDLHRTEFKTESYPMSVGELTNLYKSKEVQINPDFQRFFRWTDTQKSRLIESFILGIPVPTIFVYQREDGVWEVVDGLQRISTLMQFMGLLEDKERLILQGTKYLPSLEGYVWEKKLPKDNVLPESIKLNLKRAKLNFSIILSDSGENAKFDVFQRLNTGGSFASDQEVRNSVMIMINKPTYEWFKEISKDQNFLDCISIASRLIDEQYPMELALRFISFRYFQYSQKKELRDFFDEVVEIILKNKQFPYEKYGDDFKKLFKLLNNLAGDGVFKRYSEGNFKGSFLESAFEAVSIGIGTNLDTYKIPEDNQSLIDKIKGLHTQETFRTNSGSGSNARNRVPKILPFAIEYFKI
jgi:hypothetical protein